MDYGTNVPIYKLYRGMTGRPPGPGAGNNEFQIEVVFIMNTKIALILSCALILSTVLYCLGNRYHMVGVNEMAYMYDRITGKSWFHVADSAEKVSHYRH